MSLFENLEFAECEVAVLRQSLDGALELVYERDVEVDPRVGYRKICRSIDLPETPVEILDRRATPYRLRRVVANYDDVVAHLRGTRFEWMALDE